MIEILFVGACLQAIQDFRGASHQASPVNRLLQLRRTCLIPHQLQPGIRVFSGWPFQGRPDSSSRRSHLIRTSLPLAVNLHTPRVSPVCQKERNDSRPSIVHNAPLPACHRACRESEKKYSAQYNTRHTVNGSSLDQLTFELGKTQRPRRVRSVTRK